MEEGFFDEHDGCLLGVGVGWFVGGNKILITYGQRVRHNKVITGNNKGIIDYDQG